MSTMQSLFEQFAGLKIGVIGDVMLDTYMWGEVERISPEAPVPIVTLRKKEYRVGGAGNVALNLQSLGALAYVITVTGDDDDGRQLMQLFQQEGIHTAYSIASPERITTNKMRVISRNQQMMRLDAEITADIRTREEDALIARVEAFIQQEAPRALILEDYNKGVLTTRVIEAVVSLCKQAGVITAVDPKRKNFFTYRNVDIFKPNLKEVRDALNLLSTEADLPHLKDIHARLHEQLHHAISLITLSEKGVFYQDEKKASIIPSHVRNIADVSGAGDTVVAVATLVYAATRNVELMASMANIAGGLVCEEVGTAAIRKDRLLQECELLLG